MTTIYWYSQIKNMETFCEESIAELVELLKSNYPSLPALHTERLSDELAIGLTSYLCQPTDDLPKTASPKLLNKKIIVYCEREAKFAVIAREKEPMAVLGAAILELYAMVWTRNKYVFWHEALHLLNVRDSYDSSGKTTCEEQDCIMQHNPNQENCSNTLVLCKDATDHAYKFLISEP